MADHEIFSIPFTTTTSKKIASLSAGEAHTLALTGNGNVYSWGRGNYGRLGTGKEDDELVPVKVEFDSLIKTVGTQKGEVPKFIGIAAGAYHSLALQDDGSVWCWGYNDYGQLGSDEETSLVPRLLEWSLKMGSLVAPVDEENIDKNEPSEIRSVSAGGMMSLAIDMRGGLWIWGNCPPESINNDSTEYSEFFLVSSPIPRPVWDLNGQIVLKVACGNEHVVALATSGDSFSHNILCYSWGNNTHGQLGLGDTRSRFLPEIMETFDLESLWQVYDVACGAFHTAVLVEEKIRGEEIERRGGVWTFGCGDNGQLGHGTTDSKFLPEPVEELPQDMLLVSVDCGLFHTCVVSSTGEVWSWGMEKGLGLCPDASFTGTDGGDATFPLRIQPDSQYGPTFIDPVQVVCGAAHTILVAGEGFKLWAWGRGQSGVLGRGNTVDSFAPCIVTWPLLDKLLLGSENVDDEESGKEADTNKRLSFETEELDLLRSKLSIMERYASTLHRSMFGKPFDERDLPPSLQISGTFDIGKEWENMLEVADHHKLTQMEVFYRRMLGTVKDKLMKRRIQELIKECVRTSATGKLLI